MSTQLLIYEKAVTVTNQRHRDWSIKKGTDYTFAKHVNAVPLTAVEFAAAAAEYAIVFTGTAETIMPAVILGMRDRQNLYLNEDGSWRAKYLPAFIRRYPFVFASSDEGKRFTLCLDEAFSGSNQVGLGERLFDAQGTRTQYLEGVLNFLQQYQGQFQLTQAFCKKLHELDLLEPMRAQITVPTGEKIALTGFMAVNRDRLKKLTGEKLTELVQTNELELIYIHLQSLRNVSVMADRLSGSLSPDGQAESAGESTAQPSPDATDKRADKGKKKPLAALAT
jgi:hypothetical protein